MPRRPSGSVDKTPWDAGRTTTSRVGSNVNVEYSPGSLTVRPWKYTIRKGKYIKYSLPTINFSGAMLNFGGVSWFPRDPITEPENGNGTYRKYHGLGVVLLADMVHSLKLTASLHLKMDGWNEMNFLLGPGMPIFRCYVPVSFRDCQLIHSRWFKPTPPPTSFEFGSRELNSPSPKMKTNRSVRYKHLCVNIQTYVPSMEADPAPVEVGSLSHYLQGVLIHPTGGCLGFLNHQQYIVKITLW